MAIRATAVFDTRARCSSAMEVTARPKTPVERHTHPACMLRYSSPHLSLSLQGGPIQNMESQRCLELVESRQSEFSFQLAIQDCTDQKWTITNILTVLPQ